MIYKMANMYKGGLELSEHYCMGFLLQIFKISEKDNVTFCSS